MRSRSAPWATPSTTSSSTPLADLAGLVDALPPGERRRVFSHASWHAERGRSYERLEFLGDAVLGLAVADELLRRYPDADEGRLARLKAYAVSRPACAHVARELGLDTRLVAQGLEGGHGDVAELARQQSVLAALIEAAIGAVYLARGFDAVREAVVAAFAGRLQAAADERFDHKTDLQEALQRQGRSVQYEVVDVSGPPHRRAFVSVARVDGTELGRGGGSSKKASEQEAARVALAALAAGAA